MITIILNQTTALEDQPMEFWVMVVVVAFGVWCALATIDHLFKKK